MINQWFKYYKWRLLNPIIPCAICKIPGLLPVCNHCCNELEINLMPYCNYCAVPGSSTCKDCCNNPPAFSYTYCQYTYSTPLNKMLHYLKYKYNKSNVWALGYLLSKVLEEVKTDTSFIVPMPLSNERLKQRGFNQASELLKFYCAKLNHIPVKTNIVSRITDTPHQTFLNRQKRHNSQIIFQVEKNVMGKNILIVDDVITTGSTANNLAKALLTAGARRVELCALMRTI
ncbi:MAG TPA: phosphoribosyltransferase family protein [Aquella sp.]|nr:phosphoribosyltransferase family protein [Aquella sp.]